MPAWYTCRDRPAEFERSTMWTEDPSDPEGPLARDEPEQLNAYVFRAERG